MSDELDFDQMLGELAAMKTDLANRQYTRSGSTRTPRRTRVPRTTTNGADSVDLLPASSTEAKVETAGTDNSTPESALALTDGLLDSLSVSKEIEQNSQVLQQQPHHQQKGEQEQEQPHQNLQNEPQEQVQQNGSQHEQGSSVLSPVVEEPSVPSELPGNNQLQEEVQAQEQSQKDSEPVKANNSENVLPQQDLAQQPNTVPVRPIGPKSLARSDSRRQVGGAPVPAKSAQRTRSISRGSANSHSSHDSKEQATETTTQIGRIEEQATPASNANGVPRQNTTARPAVPQRSHSRANAYARSQANQQLQQNGVSNGTTTPSMGVTAGTAITGVEHGSSAFSPPHTPTFGGSSGPAIPPRSRSGSSSLSRSASLNKHDIHSQSTQQQQGESIGTFQPPLSVSQQIPEDPELEETQDTPKSPVDVSSQEKQGHENDVQRAQQTIQQQQQPFSQQVYQHSRQLSQPNPGYSGMGDDQHALLPAATIPTQGDAHSHAQRPVLRKQKSADPAALYREQQQQRPHDDDPTEGRGRLPSRHVSERHPRKPSTNDDHDDRGRGRKESGGGFFAWARSRSKSRDPSKSKDHNNNQAPPMPEPSEQYNPALIPSRSMTTTGALLREKSLPRKASNNNLQEGWPSYDPHAVSGASPQRNKSLTRGPSSGGPFSRLNRKQSENNLTHHLPGSIISQTNANTTHHEAMVRGMGMGSTPMTPAVLLTPQPSVPLNAPSTPGTSGAARGMALAMMKDGTDTTPDMHASPSAQQIQNQQQMQQRAQQLQQAQLQHLQLQQQKLAAAMGTAANDPTSPKSPTGPSVANQTIKMVATRIYIQTETDFKSVNLTATSTALDVLRMLHDRGTFGEPGDGRYHDRWTIFEYSKEFMIERPLRDFEVILDIMKTWEADKDNKMICKSFPARDELTAKEVARLVSPAGQASFVRPHGWVHIELKKGKWTKRYLHITDSAIYHSKDEKFTGETMLCFMRNFDVFSVQVPRKKAPTKFGFALRSSDSIHIYESPEDDYIHYICTDTGESLRDWLTGLRAAKGIFMYHANPETIRDGIKHAIELNGESTSRLTDEQVSMAEAKLAGWGLTRSGTNTIRRLSQGYQQAPNSGSSSTDAGYKGNGAVAATTAGVEVSIVSGTNKNQVVSSADGSHSNSSNAPAMNANGIGNEVNMNADLINHQFLQQAHNQLHHQHSASAFSHTMLNEKSSSVEVTEDSVPTGSSKMPFSAGSLLQQQVEAERQQVELMKQQLRQREQAGVLGAIEARTKDLSPAQGEVAHVLRAPAASTSSTAPTLHSGSRMPLTPLITPDPPKFGGPGTLLERREQRAAELERAKQANLKHLQAMARSGSGTLVQLGPSDGPLDAEKGISKPSRQAQPGLYGNQQYGWSRAEGSSRAPMLTSATSTPSLGSSTSSPASTSSATFTSTSPGYPPNGPLLRFDQEETKEIQPGLLLDRAKSLKISSSSSNRYPTDGSGAPLKSPGLNAPPLLGYGFGGGTGPAPPPVPPLGTNIPAAARGPNARIKPLVDLGDSNGSQKILSHGLLAAHQQQVKSPRKPGPLVNLS
ncbi:hypothetical protein BGW42_008290 [Actinomortierella wolfii]|nr:hypothetical protein BGW42_008290 [Actinomortierella wolfii]